MIKDLLIKIHSIIVCALSILTIFWDIIHIRIVLGVITFFMAIAHLVDKYETACTKVDVSTSPVPTTSPFSDVIPYPIPRIDNGQIKYPVTPVYPPARIEESATVPAP